MTGRAKIDDRTVARHLPKPTPFWATVFVGPVKIYPSMCSAPTWARSPARRRPTSRRWAPARTRSRSSSPATSCSTRSTTTTTCPTALLQLIEIKGGGDAASAARAVFQTGESDYAWNLQVEDEVLQPHGIRRAKARLQIIDGSPDRSCSRSTSPTRWPEVDGERAEPEDQAPVPSPTRTCARPGAAVDRKSDPGVHLRSHRCRDLQYPRQPAALQVAQHPMGVQNIDKANQLLDAAGWRRGPDGMREKGGRKMSFVYQTSVNRCASEGAGDRQGRRARRRASSSS